MNRVRFSGGARPPGRSPLRTSSVGCPLAASAARAGPSPRCAISPAARQPRPRLRVRLRPAAPARQAAVPPQRRARAERRARRWRGCGSRPSRPRKRARQGGVGRADYREPGAELDRAPVVLAAREGDEDRPRRRDRISDRNGHVAQRRAQELRELRIVERAASGRDEHEVRVLLRREPGQVPRESGS